MILKNFDQLADMIQPEYKKNSTRVCTILSYLIGVQWDKCKHYIGDDEDLFNELDKNPHCRIIRNLCFIRSNLMLNFTETHRLIRFELTNLDNQEKYKDSVRQLHDDGVDIIKSKYDVNDYIALTNKIISDRINNVRDVFPEWLKWEYVKSLFLMPQGQKEEYIINESKKYNAKRSCYPYTMYINWTPYEDGNILIADSKIVKIIYEQNGDLFTDYSKVKDAKESVVTNIYDFINESNKIQLVVDCENSDAFKLASVLKQLDKSEIEKIDKIILYDDIHTTNAWSYLGTMTNVPVEHKIIERVNNYKSLVDIKMGMGISKAYYQENVDSFILLSSDSDFWGVISSLPEASFLVMVEQSKCGVDIQNALIENGTYYCFIDDFCTGNIKKFKTTMLCHSLEDKINNLVFINTKDLVNELYHDLRIDATQAEKQNFYDKTIRKISVAIDKEGFLKLRVPDM